MRFGLLAALIATPLAAAPVAQGPANVPSFKPAFPNQTRAEAVKTRTPLKITEVATGLDTPWGLAFLPDGRMLVSEKQASALRIVSPNGAKSARLTGTPPTDTRGQGGMFDVALSPDYATSGTIFWSYAESRTGGTGLAVARGRLVTGAAPRVENVRVIFRMMPTLDSIQHYGARLVFARDGTLFVTMGERSILPGRVQAQNLKSDLGKIARINPDGSVPKNNPFVGKAGVRPEIWSYGHRNVEAAALDAGGRLWEVEMGPRGGDELNRPEAGKDYGWPTIGYGEEYSGLRVGKGLTQAKGMEQPVYYWDPVIAPSGLAIYSGKAIPEWKGNFFIGGLASTALVRLVLRDDRVVGEERLLTERGDRIRDVVEGPDGALYLLTDDSSGKILRVGPAKP
ncbi:PQQ-dependent sugar dehydrogenase [Sphingosinicellaceae bacterium]|nr:PQQ-dependent sugar dehydrogenase [Sphingosinicellaceae bacterium]